MGVLSLDRADLSSSRLMRTSKRSQKKVAFSFSFDHVKDTLALIKTCSDDGDHPQSRDFLVERHVQDILERVRRNWSSSLPYKKA